MDRNFKELLVISLLMLSIGCTSGEAKKDAPEGEEAAVEASQANAEGESELSEETDSDAGDDFAETDTDSDSGDDFADTGSDSADFDDEATSDSSGGEDFAASDDFGESTAQADTGMDDDFNDDATSTVDSPSLDSSTTSTDTLADTSSSDFSSPDTSSFDSAPPVAAKPNIPLRKIESTPFDKAGALLNSVYIARPGDTVESVSKMLLGEGRQKDLVSWNSILKRGVKVGDKIYYNSPQRPTDNSTIKVYYEDIGVSPQVYSSKAGENIRDVATQLLGHKDSWKEIWATNTVESKWAIPEGTVLKYWPTGAGQQFAPSPGLNQAEATLPPAQDEQLPPPAPELPQDIATNPPGMDEAPDMLEMPDSAGSDMGGNMAGVTDTPPPPPPADSFTPPPPPQPLEAASTAEEEMGLGDDTTMFIGIGAILLAAALGIVVLKRRRAKEMEFGQETSF